MSFWIQNQTKRCQIIAKIINKSICTTYLLVWICDRGESSPQTNQIFLIPVICRGDKGLNVCMCTFVIILSNPPPPLSSSSTCLTTRIIIWTIVVICIACPTSISTTERKEGSFPSPIYYLYTLLSLNTRKKCVSTCLLLWPDPTFSLCLQEFV